MKSIPPSSWYRGSPKHKNRPSTGRKGTLCPEWTHISENGKDCNSSTCDEEWQTTQAHALFEAAVVTPQGRRYATARGVAFEAKPTGDGSWHGYPVPWDCVPPAILGQWLSDGRVSKRAIRWQRRYPPDNIHWALNFEPL